MTADHLLASWARSKRAANRSERTIASYIEDAELLATHLDGTPITAATRRDVEAFFVAERARGMSPATVARRYRSLVQLYRWLDDEDELDGPNPMAKIQAPAVPEDPPPVVTVDVFERLVAAAGRPRRRPGQPAPAREGRAIFENRRDPALIRMLWGTGVRASEIMGLRVVDVDLRAETFDVVGKGSRRRAVSLLPVTADAVDRYLRARARHRHTDLDWLWLGDKGRFTDSGLRQMLEFVAHRPHLLRDVENELHEVR